MKKKFTLVLLVITVCLFTPTAVNATTTTEMYGFEYSTDGFIAIEDNWNTYLSMPVIDINNYTLGVVTTFIGVITSYSIHYTKLYDVRRGT